MNLLLLRVLAILVCIGIVAFGALMIHDFGTGYRRFQRVQQRRDARKARRS
jgi:hypothetical protein